MSGDNPLRRTGLITYAVTLVGVALTLGLPFAFDMFGILQATIYAVMAMLALSLGFVWGGGGILCFGQAAFFGLGGYTYAVAVIDVGDSTIPILLAIVVPTLFALLLGYFMFFGRLSEIFVGIITLCVSLILYNFANSTSDPFYHIGQANLNGVTGLSGVPSINWPFAPNAPLNPVGLFMLTMGSLTANYLVCKLIDASRFGRVMRAVKDNEARAELMGYNTAGVKLRVFCIGAAMAGLAGCLFANWNAFISPTVFDLGVNAQLIIWVMVGGLGSYLGPIVGAVGLQALSAWLGTKNWIDVNVVLGTILMGVVVLLPDGIVPTLERLALGRRPPPNADKVGAESDVPAPSGN